MNLKILLPFKVFTEKTQVLKIIVQTPKGSFGLLPNRRDCVASLIPSILIYQTQNNPQTYIAIDEGILVKQAHEVLISVRNAIAGDDLNHLHELITLQFLKLNEQEQTTRSVLAKLETGFARRFWEFNRGQ
jgi:F-type H+-transporting ATPase subunit epsilon